MAQTTTTGDCTVFWQDSQAILIEVQDEIISITQQDDVIFIDRSQLKKFITLLKSI